MRTLINKSTYTFALFLLWATFRTIQEKTPNPPNRGTEIYRLGSQTFFVLVYDFVFLFLLIFEKVAMSKKRKSCNVEKALENEGRGDLKVKQTNTANTSGISEKKNISRKVLSVFISKFNCWDDSAMRFFVITSPKLVGVNSSSNAFRSLRFWHCFVDGT